MLIKIVDLVLLSECNIESGTLFCNNIHVKNEDVSSCIKFLDSTNTIENTDYINKLGSVINLELTLPRLNDVGFYESCETFILRNKYEEPEGLYYIHEIKCFSKDIHHFFITYRNLLLLIKSIKNLSKHTYFDTDLMTSIIVSEDQSLVLTINNELVICELVNENVSAIIKELLIIFNEPTSDKKLLFMNELFNLLNPISEKERFIYLIKNIKDYYDKSLNAYQYYLRDFSYNKLKVELDSKSVEFAQKIQGVINDSQSKLIAIPTALVLVVASFDFSKIISGKNIASVISLFIFSFLIQIFLNNQRSALKFIKQNINSYKETFKGKNSDQIVKCFSLVDLEFIKQDTRLRIVEVILWSIPFGFICLLIYILYDFIGIVWIYLILVILHAFLRFKWEYSN